MVIVADLINELETIAPPELADGGTRSGCKSATEGEVNRVRVSVDTSPGVVERAIQADADMLVAHHPLIYHPLQSVTEDDPTARRVASLIRSNTALYVMHTNYDTVPGGINDVLAEKLGVVDCKPLMTRHQDPFYKIAVFVPQEAVDAVRDAMAEAGAGRIGQYTHCSFRTPGTGTFVPLPAAHPYRGGVGKLEEVEEYRLEMVCVGSWLDNVIAAMLESHPYDEVAYDLYELANEPVKYGYGRVGLLRNETTLEEFGEHVRRTLVPRYLKVEGDPKQAIKTVALCGGSGSSFFKEAARAGADVYITGDTKHHDILDANALGLSIIDAGHFDTEKPGMVALADRLHKALSGRGVDVEYIE